MEEYFEINTIPNPKDKANCFSVATFLYTIPVFLRGYKKGFTDCFYETLPEHKTANLGNRTKEFWELEVQNARVNGKKPSLKKVLIKIFGWDYLKICIVVILCDIIIKPGMSIMLGKYLTCYEPPSNLANNKNNLYTNAVGFLGFFFLYVLILCPYLMMVHNLNIKIRIACSCLIYSKVLKLNKSAQGDVTPGLVINLLSNDLNHFYLFGVCSPYVILGPIQIIVVTYLSYLEIGVPAFLGVLLLVVLVPFFFLFGKTLVKQRTKISTKTDERIRLMNETVKGIQVIKLYAWEEYFSTYINNVRKLELKSIEKSLYIKGLYDYQQLILTILCFTVIVVTVLANSALSASSIWVVVSLYGLLAMTMISYFLQGIGTLGETNVVLGRMLTLLLAEEKLLQLDISKQEAISITDGSAEWSTSFGFKNLNICVPLSSFTAVIGPVGSGKSSLLQIILGELPLNGGKMYINCTVSYVSQEPWIFSGTVRQNILFGCKMDEKRYNTIMEICALEHDLTLFSDGDKTIVGEHGASLSGGQKARINLARAIYREADVYLLDDPLSAVDIQVGKQIFEKCIQGFLKEKTVLLVTHQLQYLKHVDRIIALENGKIIMEGPTKDFQKSESYFTESLKQDREGSTENTTDVRESQEYEMNKTQSENLQEGNQKKVFNAWRTYKYYYLSCRSYFLMISVVLTLLAVQISVNGSFYLLSYWITLEEPQSIENYSALRDMFIYGYSGTIIASVVCTVLRTLVFVKFSIACSNNMHNDMLNSVLNATHRFFNLNSSGRILNRFSKDVGITDEMLPITLMTALRAFSNLCGVLGIICFVNPWFILPSALLIFGVYYARKFYLRTSLKLMQMEGRLRSPMYGHVNASMQGITTIRAFHVEKTLENEFFNHQDRYSSVLYLVFATSRAFGYWCDVICFSYMVALVIYFIFDDEVSVAYIGLTLTQAFQLTGQLQYCLRQLNDVDNSMISVERIQQYTILKQDRKFDRLLSTKLPCTWPDNGEITFENVSMKYGPSDPYILKELNFVIHPSEKIGIVGRTGAGKSSIICALFQLTDIEGTIKIDQIDTKTINLQCLRKNIAIIPQDPILFSNTIRKNLDPGEELDDEVIWKALETAGLQKTLNHLNLGLDSKVISGGSNFSIGQRQLFCLARAIVKNNRIIILDEATANIDLETDCIIQETIRKKFCDCTVITIAHRLNTVMDSDKVLFMDSGKIVEFDHPHILLKNKNGHLHNFVQKTEKIMADTLYNIALKSYEGKQNN